uniref:Secreted protein n=1 Tax=Heterorhabditis bacteriophora TaxID=37862 RepID=A0A1I7WIC5_HETBA
MTLNLLKLGVANLVLACIAIKFTNLFEIEECHTSQISTDLFRIFYFKSVNSATVTIYNITEKKYKVMPSRKRHWFLTFPGPLLYPIFHKTVFNYKYVSYVPYKRFFRLTVLALFGSCYLFVDDFVGYRDVSLIECCLLEQRLRKNSWD